MHQQICLHSVSLWPLPIRSKAIIETNSDQFPMDFLRFDDVICKMPNIFLY